MADALLTWFRQSLPEEIAGLTEPYLAQLEQGKYQSLLEDPIAKSLFGHTEDETTRDAKLGDFRTWADFIFQRLGTTLADRYAAVLAFLQSNVTGPPLPFSSPRLLFQTGIADVAQEMKSVRSTLLASLSMDGIAAYKLTPNIELLCLAETIMTCPPIIKTFPAARWAKMRIAFLQQRLLSEISSTLQEVIYDDLDMLSDSILGVEGGQELDEQTQVEFLLERATIHIHHGLDKFARRDLDAAKQKRRFEYALTGSLGKRTKFQENDISQLVVLAKSADVGAGETDTMKQSGDMNGHQNGHDKVRPAKLDLNDDTLLEAIAFSEKTADSANGDKRTTLPPALRDQDPANQPQLNPLDSTILLSFASSITNTSPQDGLTREETLPYATRVLDGGSSNWQVYTQALLVRSRIEGHRSRTVERGLLQLQALVDQVIADTAGAESSAVELGQDSSAATSFLPRPSESESAPVTQRLRYIFQLATPTRWDLEAELASRWVELGGLRSALEIYERLEMWAEAALCWAATEREDKARSVVRRQLFHTTLGSPEAKASEDETWEGTERSPRPGNAPRLYCILGDIDQSVAMYEKGWDVSGQRYARAQRSLGRYYLTKSDFVQAAGAYSKSLKVNQLNHSSWFALGCALLELAQFQKAVEAFSRCVQLDDTDAEAWSNLAASLLRMKPSQAGAVDMPLENGTLDDETPSKIRVDPQKNRLDALKALKRAATLKHESHRIWENVLTVAASVSPPDYQSILAAQKHIIDLRAKTDGERCLDTQILQLLALHVVSTTEKYDPAQPGLARMFVKFMDESVVPLITSSADLWRLVSKLALWRGKPSSALEAEEKAWRVVLAQPGWETDSEKQWNTVIEATVRLCDSYESLGPMERTEGMGSGEMVAKDWNYKARSAVRTVMGKAKSTWEGTDGWEKLHAKAEELKG
ncbi:hypothetical protein LTR53_002518 [Teratosphaeriaceae sp. CCFEE 6253]|nr:hypothetical protein LTR53_002518 [Teratosphaeriaceae sp. CCFEE 6253]